MGNHEGVDIGGFTAPGFERVAEEFERNFREAGEVGASFAAVVDGETAVDLWGGLADRAHGTAWGEDTLVPIFSGTKGLVATCLLLLIERGALELDRPVRDYWPEFAAAGKRDVLVRHVVSHRAGVPGLETPVTIEQATDDVRMAALLAAQRPVSPPGRWRCYNAMTFGWLCGELVRRADGRSVGRFLREEVAEPLGLDVWIGLPEEHDARVAVLEPTPGFVAARDADAASSDPVRWSIWSNPPRLAADRLAGNDRAWRAAEVPATNGIASARSLARLYGCLARGGELNGVRLLSPATIELGRRCLACGRDPYIEAPLAFGVGFQLQTEDHGFGPPEDAFGHGGAGGSMHGAWPSWRTGFSYAMNRLSHLGAGDPRPARLLRALCETVAARAPSARTPA